MKTIKKYQAIIFDIDGTLCDSAQLCTSAWNKVLKDNGYENQILIADFKSNLGKPFPEIIQNIIPSPFNEEENIADLLNIAEIKTIEENGWNLYSGVYETIQELSNLYNIALISNCQSDYLNMFLHLSGLQEFIADKDCWGFSNCTKNEMINNMRKRNGWNEVLYMGDTEGDYNACHLAVCDFIYAEYGYGKAEGAEKKFKIYEI